MPSLCFPLCKLEPSHLHPQTWGHPVLITTQSAGLFQVPWGVRVRGQAAGRWERRGVGVAGVTAELSKNRLRVGGLTSKNRRLPLANPFIKTTFTPSCQLQLSV